MALFSHGGTKLESGEPFLLWQRVKLVCPADRVRKLENALRDSVLRRSCGMAP